MTDQEKAKAAVSAFDCNSFYMFSEITTAVNMLLRPIAAGTSVIVPVEPTPKMLAAAWKLVRDRWPRGQFLGEWPAFKECMIAMIAASQEGEK